MHLEMRLRMAAILSKGRCYSMLSRNPVQLYHVIRVMSHLQPSVHDDVMKWKHFPRFWPFVRGIHRSPVNSHHKGQWRGALMCSLICAWINAWVNNREAGDLRRHRVHYVVIVMCWCGQLCKTKVIHIVRWTIPEQLYIYIYIYLSTRQHTVRPFAFNLWCDEPSAHKVTKDSTGKFLPTSIR